MSSTIAVVIHKVTRKPNSVNGNPRKVLYTDRGTFATKPDAMTAYAISDNWREVTAILTLEAGEVIDVVTDFPAGPSGWPAWRTLREEQV